MAIAQDDTTTSSDTVGALTQLYQSILGRAPDPAGLAYWASVFGPTLDPSEAAAFTQSAQVEKDTAAQQAAAAAQLKAAQDAAALKAAQDAQAKADAQAAADAAARAENLRIYQEQQAAQQAAAQQAAAQQAAAQQAAAQQAAAQQAAAQQAAAQQAAEQAAAQQAAAQQAAAQQAAAQQAAAQQAAAQQAAAQQAAEQAAAQQAAEQAAAQQAAAQQAAAQQAAAQQAAAQQAAQQAAAQQAAAQQAAAEKAAADAAAANQQSADDFTVTKPSGINSTGEMSDAEYLARYGETKQQSSDLYDQRLAANEARLAKEGSGGILGVIADSLKDPLVLELLSTALTAGGGTAALANVLGGGTLGNIAANAVIGAAKSGLLGQDIWKGAASGGLNAGASTYIGNQIGNAVADITGVDLSPTTLKTVGSAVTGGANAALAGQDVLQGATTGALGSIANATISDQLKAMFPDNPNLDKAAAKFITAGLINPSVLTDPANLLKALASATKAMSADDKAAAGITKDDEKAISDTTSAAAETPSSGLSAVTPENAVTVTGAAPDTTTYAPPAISTPEVTTGGLPATTIPKVTVTGNLPTTDYTPPVETTPVPSTVATTPVDTTVPAGNVVTIIGQKPIVPDYVPPSDTSVTTGLPTTTETVPQITVTGNIPTTEYPASVNTTVTPEESTVTPEESTTPIDTTVPPGNVVTITDQKPVIPDYVPPALDTSTIKDVATIPAVTTPAVTTTGTTSDVATPAVTTTGTTSGNTTAAAKGISPQFATIGKMGKAYTPVEIKQLYDSLAKEDKTTGSNMASTQQNPLEVTPEEANSALAEASLFHGFAHGGLVHHFAEGGTTLQSALTDLAKPNLSKFGQPNVGVVGKMGNTYTPAVLPQLMDVLRSRGMKFAEGGEVDPNIQGIAGIGGLAHGGNPAVHYAGAPEGHNPEFITGATGHYVQGKGTGQSDDIPAMLADGEFVLDSETVSALGDGSNKAGAAILDAMREAIRKHKRSAPINKIPPAAKSPLEYIKEGLKMKGNKNG